MKIFTFYYYFTYLLVLREFPDENPHRQTLKSISLPLGIFFTALTLFFLVESNLWWHIQSMWDPSLVEPSRYNPFAPSAIISLLGWFASSKILNWYFTRCDCLDNLKQYYLPHGEINRRYDTQARLLFFFFSFVGFGAFLLYVWKGVYGLLIIALLFAWIELWIRYEFEWSVDKGAKKNN